MYAQTPKPPIDRWSFSTLKDFEACPYRVYLKKVEKQPEPEPEEGVESPLDRGTRIHEAAEAFVRGTGPMIRELRKFETEFIGLRAKYEAGKPMIELEQKWGFDKEWTPVDWSDKECWAMVKCDLVVHEDDRRILVVDYKTGKSRGNEVKHRQQMQLYGLSAFLRYTEPTLVTTELWYLDEGNKVTKTYNRSDVLPLLPRWEQRAKNLTEALVFKPKPNRGNCKYCPFGVLHGTGVCAYAVGE